MRERAQDENLISCCSVVSFILQVLRHTLPTIFHNLIKYTLRSLVNWLLVHITVLKPHSIYPASLLSEFSDLSALICSEHIYHQHHLEFRPHI